MKILQYCQCLCGNLKMNSFFFAIFLFVLSVIQSKRVPSQFQVKRNQKYDYVLNGENSNHALFSESWNGKKLKVKNSVLKRKKQVLHLKYPTEVQQKLTLYSNINNRNKCGGGCKEDISKKVKSAYWGKKKKKLIYFHLNNINTIKKNIKENNHNKILSLLLKNKKLIVQYLKDWKSDFLYNLKRTKIITKIFVTSSLVVTLLNILGLKPESIALHNKRIIRSFEFYRIITSALFYGDISLYVLTNIYMFYLESQKLERSLGSSETLSFYISQIILLSVICSFLKKPFFSTALLKSLLFVNCMLRPDEKAHIIFGIKVNNLYLPYLSILIDVLHAQKINASLSGLLGVLSGSIYYILNIYMYENYNIKIFKIPFFLEKYLNSFDSDEFVE